MKKYLGFLVLALILLQSCIGDDVLEDAVPADLRIVSATDSVTVDSTFLFEAKYFNILGEEEAQTITWTSSDASVLSIDANGLATGVSEGAVVVLATTSPDGETQLTDSKEVVVTKDIVETPTVTARDVTFSGSYSLQGSGVLREQEDGSLVLEINGDYRMDEGLPGAYIYLTNNPNSNPNSGNNGYEVAAVDTFSGAHSYEVSGDVDLFEYNYVLFYCKPFSVKIGDGELEQF